MTPGQPPTPPRRSTVSAEAVEAGARAIVDRCPGDHDIGEARLEARAVLEAALDAVGAVPLDVISRHGRYTIPGLDGVWRPMGLKTRGMGGDGQAEIPFRRIEEGPTP